MTTIAHVSDLHVLDLAGVSAWRYLNKRATGLANLRFKRNHVHKPAVLVSTLRAMVALDPDHVVVTGDLTNLALESEFEAVRRVFADALQMPTERVSVIPGNHDAYTRGSEKKGRFGHYFGDYTHSDLPELTAQLGVGKFPFVRFLSDEVALIGLSSAVSQLPLLAGGRFGKTQLDALQAMLAHPEVRRRRVVLMGHHPLHRYATRKKQITQYLHDAPEFLRIVGEVPDAIYLHGHLHQRMERSLPTSQGTLRIFGATSASLLEDNPERRAGFNVYEVHKDTLEAYAYVLPETDDAPFQRRALPFIA